MTTSALTLPVVTIQPTFTEVIYDVQEGLIPYEKLWISCYKASETSVHAKVNAELDDRDRNRVNLTPIQGEIEVSQGVSGDYAVACRPLGIPPTRVVPPVQDYRDQERSSPSRPHRITAFNVSPDLSRFATGYLDGSVFLYPTSPLKSPRHPLIPASVDVTKTKIFSKPHLSGITSLKFFPSSRVLLSSGLDFSLTILSADLPESSSKYGTRVSPVRTMRAHSRAVTDTAIIALGRNVVSSSLDSTIKLWDVSSGEVITSYNTQSAVASISLGDRLPVPPDGEEAVPPTSNDSRELPETSYKVVFCGLESGTFQLFDLGFKKSVYLSPAPTSPSSVTSIAYSQSSNLLATGSSKGLVTIYDTRSLTTPLTSFRRLETSIEDLSFVQNNGAEVSLAVATSDGLPYVASVVPEGPAVSAELVGVDCDSVRNVTVRSEGGKSEVWCTSDDGVVRRYVL
ncbi:WD40-repeat-containing domain protein [Gymnopilus junonius]|uniref:WD40-repeat-containing domain protein n=1 Tax=Gymnopilus junonius TaxID=109634 RepID=A0A9P5NIQ9_GYMJU|nr:WD40-repeat-containing domain protein [Gymnopilus junonius]